MSRQLPDLIDPLQIAEKGQEMIGQVDISRMFRIKDSLTSSEGCLDVYLRFAKDETGQPFVKGTIKGELQLDCQRCMSPMAWRLDGAFCLAFLRSEAQIEHLAEHYEPFLLPEDKVKLIELLEDEIILQLPQAPRHEISQCPAGQTNYEFGNAALAQTQRSEPKPLSPSDAANSSKKPNPFSVLATLKKKNAADDDEK